MLNLRDYSGWDMLDSKEAEELREEMAFNDLMDELAKQNAAEYFENEIEKDFQGR